MTQIALKDLVRDAGTQHREIDDNVVKRYAALMNDGFDFPPAKAVYDGSQYYLYDGFHRWQATNKLNRTTMEVDVTEGTKRDAVFASFAANRDSGFQRQPGVASKIIQEILTDPEWSRISISEIARHIGVTRAYVSQVAGRMTKSDDMPSPVREETVSVTRGSKVYKMANPKQAEEVLDSVNFPIPPELRPIFDRTDDIKILTTSLSQIATKLDDMKIKNDQIVYHLKLEPVKAWINDLKRTLKAVLPYAVCPYCGGDGDDSCKNCSGLGWVTKSIYDAIPSDLKGGE